MTTLIIAFIIFLAYTTYIKANWPELASISESYYKVKSWVFTTFIMSIGILMAVSGDGLTFAAGGLLCGVGVAANYKWVRERGVHIFCAIAPIALGFLDITLHGYWYLTAVFGVVVIILYTGKHPQRTYIAEDWAFMLVFLGLMLSKTL